MSFKKAIETIRKTGHVHRNWYLETYPDVARLGMEPAEHYLKYGAAMGRNPGKNFNTRFYLEHYPDVAETGLNPLLHYARYGQKEGREPSGSLIERDLFRLTSHLWGGGPTAQTIEALAQIADNPTVAESMRHEAARTIAIRHAFDDDLPQALQWISIIPKIAPSMELEKSYLVVHAFLHYLQDDRGAARRLLERYLATPQGEGDADATLALSNTCEGDADRLALLNAVYTREGLAALRLRDPALPLRMDNIEGDEVPRCDADHGMVSVIMPIYMAEEIIETAVRSLCQQSYRNIEILAVDDCSIDGTFSVLERMAAEDPRIKPVRQPVNAGAYPARNRGLELAQGEFVTTHDADDWSHPQKLETQIRALVAGDAKGVVAHWVRVRPRLHVTTNWRVTSEVLHWSHSTFLARRGLFQELGPWDHVRISADTEMIWRMQAAYGAASLKKVMPNAPLALALDDGGSLTRAKQTHVSTVYYGLRRFYREIAQYWHSQPGGLSPESHAKRLAMVPEEMFRKPEAPVPLDLVLRGDCTHTGVLARMQALAEAPENAGCTIGIDHRPNIDRMPARFAPGFFALLALPRIRPVVPGTDIVAVREIDVDA